MSAAFDIAALEALAHDSLLVTMRAKCISSRDWFDITGLNPLNNLYDDAAEKVARTSREFKLLQRLHCQSYSSMVPEIREAIPALVDSVIEMARADYAKRTGAQS